MLGHRAKRPLAGDGDEHGPLVQLLGPQPRAGADGQGGEHHDPCGVHFRAPRVERPVERHERHEVDRVGHDHDDPARGQHKVGHGEDRVEQQGEQGCPVEAAQPVVLALPRREEEDPPEQRHPQQEGEQEEDQGLAHAEAQAPDDPGQAHEHRHSAEHRDQDDDLCREKVDLSREALSRHPGAHVPRAGEVVPSELQGVDAGDDRGAAAQVQAHALAPASKEGGLDVVGHKPESPPGHLLLLADVHLERGLRGGTFVPPPPEYLPRKTVPAKIPWRKISRRYLYMHTYVYIYNYN